jgi:hypothetical protein
VPDGNEFGKGGKPGWRKPSESDMIRVSIVPQDDQAMRLTSLHSVCLALVVATGLAACQTASVTPAAPPPSSAPVGVTPNTFSMPSGSGCAGEVARFQAVMDNDLDTGHTTKGVHGRVSGEIAIARATCAGGNEGGAIGQLNGTKSKFGYR